MASYDPSDQRIRKDLDSTPGGAFEATENYVVEGNRVALEFNASQQLTNRFLHGPAIDMVLADEQRNATTGALANLYWTLSDHLGSVKQIVQRVGTAAPSLVNVRKYDVFGNRNRPVNPLPASAAEVWGFQGNQLIWLCLAAQRSGRSSSRSLAGWVLTAARTSRK